MLKVTIYQKSLGEALDQATLKKLAAVRSDFLVLPEHFSGTASAVVAGANGGPPTSQALDWLLRLSDVYRGVIVGGAMALVEGDTTTVACPIVSGGSLIDWYRKRVLAGHEKKVSPGAEAGVFILAGHRFGVLVGQDLCNRDLLVELAQMGIRIIFAPVAFREAEDWHPSLLQGTARELGLYIACCSGAGDLNGARIAGQSMMVTPDGVSWRVSEPEAGREIIKTVMFAMKG